MEPSALQALRAYAATRQTLSPESATMPAPKVADAFAKETEQQALGSSSFSAGLAPAVTDVSPSSAVMENVKTFSEVFQKAETTALNFSVGKADAQSVVEALAVAEVALETAVTVRNRVVEAYQEILRMPV